MARISKSEIEREKKELLEELRKNTKKANFRLSMLHRYYGKDSWSSKILIKTLKSKKIQGLKNNKVFFSEDMSLSQLRAINKASKNFTESRTSTYKGLQEIRRETIQSFRERYADSDNFNVTKISTEDAEKLYSVFEDKQTRKFAEKHGGSETVQLLADNMKKGATEEEFFKDVYANLIDEGSVDIQTKRALKKIYNNIIK